MVMLHLCCMTTVSATESSQVSYVAALLDMFLLFFHSVLLTGYIWELVCSGVLCVMATPIQ